MGREIPRTAPAVAVGRALAAFALCGAVLAAGCYTVPESALVRQYNSIYVPTLENLTIEPGLHTRVTRALRREFQNNGQLRLVNSADAADLVLEGTLTEFRVRASSFDDNDNPLQFVVFVVGDVEVHQRAGGDVVWQKHITADDFYQVRRARRAQVRARGRAVGLDEAAEEFAEAVVYSLVDSAW